MEKGNFSIETKKVRKSLLLFSTIGFTISQLGIIINKLSLLGSEFIATNIEIIPLILSLIIAYFWISFLILGLHEYSDSYRNARRENLLKISNGNMFSEELINKTKEEYEKEIIVIKNKIKESPSIPIRVELEKKLEELFTKISRHNLILKLNSGTKISFFERINIQPFKTFIDLLLPLLIGSFVFIRLAFYTDIPIQNNFKKDIIIENEKFEVEYNSLVDTLENKNK